MSQNGYTPLHRSLISKISSKISSKIAEIFAVFFPKFRKFCQNFAEFSPNLTKFFRDFSKMQHFSEIPNYPALIPPLIRNRRSFAGFWSRSVCCHLASSSARPAAALRDRRRGIEDSSYRESSGRGGAGSAEDVGLPPVACLLRDRARRCLLGRRGPGIGAHADLS